MMAENKTLILTLAALLMSGCAAHRGATVAEHITHDTLYVNRIAYDSVYIDRWQQLDRSHGDTIYKDEVLREYRYTYIHDTIRNVYTDTVPVIHEVQVVKRERYVPTVCKWSFWILAAIAIATTIACITKNAINKKH